MYSEFGCALGDKPTSPDSDLADLTVAVLPLPGGEFYHYGTSHEILSSTLAIQNLVNDQREIMHHSLKPHPSLFVQNAERDCQLTAENQNIWIENSWVGKNWTLTRENIITGVPENDWSLHLQPGQCVDIVPVEENGYVVRPYGFNDKFRGNLSDPSVEYLGMPFTQWAAERNIDINGIEGKEDLQSARIFPVVYDTYGMQLLLRWMIGGRQELSEEERDEALALWQETTSLTRQTSNASPDSATNSERRAGHRWQRTIATACSIRWTSAMPQRSLPSTASQLRNLLPTPLRC